MHGLGGEVRRELTTATPEPLRLPGRRHTGETLGEDDAVEPDDLDGVAEIEVVSNQWRS